MRDSPWGFDRRARGLLGGPVIQFGETRTYIYVDGFNLYYGASKNSPWKWLGLVCQNVLQPHHQILTLKFFTARVSVTRMIRLNRRGKTLTSAPYNTIDPR